jgi:hypothetical protein
MLEDVKRFTHRTATTLRERATDSYTAEGFYFDTVCKFYHDNVVESTTDLSLETSSKLICYGVDVRASVWDSRYPTVAYEHRQVPSPSLVLLQIPWKLICRKTA